MPFDGVLRTERSYSYASTRVAAILSGWRPLEHSHHTSASKLSLRTFAARMAVLRWFRSCSPRKSATLGQETRKAE